MSKQEYGNLISYTLPSIAYENKSSELAKSLLDKALTNINQKSFTNREIDHKFAYKQMSYLMYFSVMMHEEFYFAKKQKPFNFNFQGSVLNALKELQDNSPVNETSLTLIKPYFTNIPNEKEMMPLKSSIPTLILTGGQDFRTPKYWAVKAQKYLSSSKHFFFAKEGHILSLSNQNSHKIISSFLNNLNNLNILDDIKGDDFIQLKP